MTTYTDTDERDALREGVWALNYCREVLAGRTSESRDESVAKRLEDFRRFAAILTEMADCYVEAAS
jgi:hypothetical protein